MAEADINININARDRSGQAINRVKVNLMELGGKVRMIGSTMTMGLTAPVVGAFAAIISKSKELQVALEPVKQAFSDVGQQLGVALVPAMVRLTPALVSIATAISNLVAQFAALSPAQQDNILKAIAVVAALGPVITIAGTAIQIIAALQSGFVAFGAVLPGITAAISGIGLALAPVALPVIALGLALAGLAYVVITYWRPMITTLQQAYLIFAKLLGMDTWKLLDLAKRWGLIGGSNNQDNLGAFNGQSINSGSVGIASTGGRYGGSVILNYSPIVSLASQSEAETRLMPFIQAALRKVR
jgi:hypothetical protein